MIQHFPPEDQGIQMIVGGPHFTWDMHLCCIKVHGMDVTRYKYMDIIR